MRSSCQKLYLKLEFSCLLLHGRTWGCLFLQNVFQESFQSCVTIIQPQIKTESVHDFFIVPLVLGAAS